MGELESRTQPSPDLPVGPSAALALNPLSELSDAEWEQRLDGIAKAVDRFHQLYERVMQEDVHFGTIPGTPKPTLYKAGAELIFKLFGCVPEYTRVRHYGDGNGRPNVTCDAICRAVHVATGRVLAEGAGSCNTHERKYRYRGVGKECPACGTAAIMKSRYEGQAYYCNPRKDGCGQAFATGSEEQKAIDAQVAGQVINPDPFDQENTVVKICDKRAYVACALTLGGASGFFNQDLDDRDERDEAAKAAPKKEPAAKGKAAKQGAGHPIDAGKKAWLGEMAEERAKALGLDVPDAGSTLLGDVLRKQGFASLDEVTVDQMNVMVSAIKLYELPKS